MTKLDIAVKLLAGFCANPSVFVSNDYSGWGLVNCDERQLAQYALELAEALLSVTNKDAV